MPAEQPLKAQQGDTLDQLLWREAGLGPADWTRVLDANPGLADAGTVLPLGTVVIVPASAEQRSARVLPLVQLWS
jgi:phage tail protein X